MSESTFKESFLDGKYGKPKMPAPTPNKVQRLNKVHTSFGKLSIHSFIYLFIYLFFVFELEMLILKSYFLLRNMYFYMTCLNLNCIKFSARICCFVLNLICRNRNAYNRMSDLKKFILLFITDAGVLRMHLGN